MEGAATTASGARTERRVASSLEAREGGAAPPGGPESPGGGPGCPEAGTEEGAAAAELLGGHTGSAWA